MTTLSSHEILRFSLDQREMRVRHVSLNYHRVIVSLRDHSPQRNLWEVANIRGATRLTRFPKLYPVGFSGVFGHRFETPITQGLFDKVIDAHRPAIIATVRDRVALQEQEAAAANRDDADLLAERLREMRHVAGRLFPEDFGEG